MNNLYTNAKMSLISSKKKKFFLSKLQGIPCGGGGISLRRAVSNSDLRPSFVIFRLKQAGKSHHAHEIYSIYIIWIFGKH